MIFKANVEKKQYILLVFFRNNKEKRFSEKQLDLLKSHIFYLY